MKRGCNLYPTHPVPEPEPIPLLVAVPLCVPPLLFSAGTSERTETAGDLPPQPCLI